MTADAAELIDENVKVELWDWMAFADSFEDNSRVSYFGIEKKKFKESARRNCYIAAEFAADNCEPSSGANFSDSEMRKLVYYG